MITVKLYGLLRIESGIKEKQLDVQSIKDMQKELVTCGLSPKALSGCMILINGKNGNARSKLKDGDTIVLMSPVAGG